MSRRWGVMYLVVASCGSGRAAQPVGAVADAPVVDVMADAAIDSMAVSASDAAIDAAPDAAQTNEVTVITKGFLPDQPPALPVAGIQIVSDRADGSVLATATSDALGVAHVEVVPGGSVTAIYMQLTDGMSVHMATIMGVKPGDQLVFQNLYGEYGGPVLGTQTYTFPAQPNAGQYNVVTSCGGNGAAAPRTSLTVSEGTSCHAEPMDAIFSIWSGGIGSVLTQCGWVEDVTFSTTIPVNLPSWQDAAPVTVSIEGVSPPVTDVSLVFAAIIDGRTPALINSRSGPPRSGQLAGTFNWCPVGDRVMAYAMLARDDLQGHMRIAESIPTSQTTWRVSYPQLPPWIDPVGFAANPVTGTLSWTLVPDYTNVSDGVSVSLYTSMLVDGYNRSGTWDLVLPPNTTTVTLPTLPGVVTQPAPNSIRFREVSTYDFPTVTGYDALRALGAGIALCPTCAQQMGLVPRSTVSFATPFFVP